MNSEEAEKAQSAQEEEVTLFDKIARKEIPASILYEDDLVRASYCNCSLGNGIQRC